MFHWELVLGDIDFSEHYEASVEMVKRMIDQSAENELRALFIERLCVAVQRKVPQATPEDFQLEIDAIKTHGVRTSLDLGLVSPDRLSDLIRNPNLLRMLSRGNRSLE